MLYYIHQTFDINLLQYITVRAGFSFFLALIITLYLMPKFIRWAQKSSSVQPINEYVKAHECKAKTPTMGGIVFIFSTIISSLLTVKLNDMYAVGALLTITLFALIGFKDDYAKIKSSSNSDGLSAGAKFHF